MISSRVPPNEELPTIEDIASFINAMPGGWIKSVKSGYQFFYRTASGGTRSGTFSTGELRKFMKTMMKIDVENDRGELNGKETGRRTD